MATFGERIKTLRIKINISQQELADELGYKTFTTVSKWEANASVPPGKELIKLSSFFDVSTDYLLGLENQPLKYTVGDIHNTVELPLYDSLNEFGSSNDNSDDNLKNIPKAPVPQHVLSEAPDNYFVTKTNTDSMNRVINNGDYIVVLDYSKMDTTELQTSDIIIVKIDNEYKIEQLRITDSKIYLEPNSYYEGFETIIMTKEEFEKIKIIGKIIYTYRQFNQSTFFLNQ